MDNKSGIIYLFAKHKVAANLLMIMMFISGLWALLQMNTQFLPNFSVNKIMINVVWPGASSGDVNESITRPIEEELRNLDNVDEMRSKSQQGNMQIILDLKQGVNVNNVLEQVKQKMSLVRNLPPDSEPPIIEEIIHYEPIARLIISGPPHLQEFRQIIHEIEQELLDRGIAKVTVTGLPKLEIRIEISSKSLHELNLSLPEIANLIKARSKDSPAGTIGDNTLTYNIRSTSQRRTIADFNDLPIITDNQGHLLRLGDIAKINFQPRQNEVMVTYKGKPAVELELFRTPEASTLKSAKILHEWYKHHDYEKSISIQIFDQTWHHIEERINLLLKNGLGGLILIIIILYFFLNSKVAFWVMMGIPISFMASLFVLHCFGGTINMVSLFAIIMSLGIIVDDTIVVGEESLTQRQKGRGALQSVVIGAKKMFVPVMASSLTTVCAFLPLFLIGNIMGVILREIPLVVISVIIASLFECFWVLPGHLFQSFCSQKNHLPSKFRIKFDARFDHFRDKMFKPFLQSAIKNRWLSLSIVLAILIFIIGLLMAGYLNFVFFPSPPGQIVHANITYTTNATKAEKLDFEKELNRSLEQTDKEFNQKIPIVRFAVSYMNKGTVYRGLGKHMSAMVVELSPPDSREITNRDFIEQWQKNIVKLPGVEHISIAPPRAGPPGADISIQLRGDDIYQTKRASIALQHVLSQIPGVSNIEDDLPYGQTQLIFDINHQGQSLGLTVDDLSKQMHAAFSGQLVQIFHQPREEIEVRIMLPENERENLNALDHLLIRTPQGEMVLLKSVITLKSEQGIDIINHTDTKLAVKVMAEVDPEVNNNNTIIQQLEHSVLPEIMKKYNVKYSLRGRSREQAETFSDMRYGMLIGLTLIYIILAWVFSSYGWPLLVMIVIPLGLAGAIFGHWVLGLSVTILSLFGLFGLSGIIINDAIILLNRYQQIHQEYSDQHQAIVEAATQRLRAVLLTSLTTIAGLLPLLFETSLQAQFLIPMAVSISFGLAFGTLLILIIIPVMLSIYVDINEKFKCLKKKTVSL